MTRFLVFFLDQLQIGVQTVPNAMFYLLSSIFYLPLVHHSVCPSFLPSSIHPSYIHTYIHIYIYIYIYKYIHTYSVYMCVCVYDGWVHLLYFSCLPFPFLPLIYNSPNLSTSIYASFILPRQPQLYLAILLFPHS